MIPMVARVIRIRISRPRLLILINVFVNTLTQNSTTSVLATMIVIKSMVNQRTVFATVTKVWDLNLIIL